MNIFGKFISNFKDAYNEINGATLTGAIDAVVVRQKDGSFISSPFHVRFGKIGVLRSREKVVDIEINGESVDIHMKLGETGEAFFVEELEEGDEVSSFLGTSPLPHYLDFTHPEDDARSQDSGVEAEEVICKSLKVKQGSVDDITARSSPGADFPTKCRDKSPVMRATFDGAGRESAAASDPTGEGRVAAGETAKARSLLDRRRTLLPNFSPCVDVPRQGSSMDDLVRSKSLTSEFPIRRVSSGILDGQGSKTDVEDTVKLGRRRRKKRTNSKKSRPKQNESQSSDNSTTSETVDISSFSVTDRTHEPIFVMEDLESAHETNRVALEKAALKESSNWASNLSTSMGPDFHPFSDTDISPPPSPNGSRATTPVKSDTEYEYEKQKNELSKTSAASRGGKWSWTWGELPTPPVTPRSNASSRQGHVGVSSIQEGGKMQSMAQVEADAHRSMLGGMLSFMRITKKARHNPESEGIYLDDLNLEELDPEVAALYFPRNSLLLEKQDYTGFRSVAKDDDVESGNGTSLPQSPHSVDGAIGGAKLLPLDSDFEEGSRHPIFDYRGYHDLAFSLCGALHEHLDEPFPEALFLQSLVTYDDFCENPDVIESPNLVVRLAGKYMNWATAVPQIMSLVLFQRPLPSKVIENVVKGNMPKKEIRKRSESKGYSWFYWGRHEDQASQQNAASKGEQGSPSGDSSDGITSSLLPSAAKDQESRPAPSEESSAQISTVAPFPEPHGIPDTATTVNGSLQEVKEASTVTRKRNDSSESEDQDESGNGKRYRKTIRLSTDQINKLNLRNGSNEVVFSVTTAYQGTTRCKCHIFLWNYDEKIVVSDIDGTITKSDVLGHILPIIGKDWAQGGVAQLFTKIKNNGYNFLYLSARAIGQARVTRDYLRSIKQGDVSLPDGPLLLNPTSLIQAFHREVIERKPEEFKISCLKDIKALFPGQDNPFYAGYGNKINDVWAYSAVGIPIQRNFTINHRGELKHELTQTFQTTYSNLTDIAHHMFPAAQEREIHDEFSSLQFWRSPLPDYSAEIKAALSQRPVK